MGDKIKQLTKEQITILQMVVFFIGIVVFAFWDTDLFQSLPSIVKFLIYGSFLIVSSILGIKFVDLKTIGTKMREILMNNKLTTEGKLKELTNLAVYILTKLGEAWELFDAEQTEALQAATDVKKIEEKKS